MFDVGGPELLLILFAVILLFGPKKIPEISQMLGKGVQKVRNAQSQFQEQMKDIEKEVKSSVDYQTLHNRPSTAFAKFSVTFAFGIFSRSPSTVSYT
jgi:sec-independent protein translocase protein TatA